MTVRSPGRRGPSHTSEADRFWNKVDRSGGCWVWTGAMLAVGYGKFWTGDRATRKCEMAHRVAWRLANGPVPPGMEIDHLCFNKACVNPSHLEPVTPKINTCRAVAAGRRVQVPVAHCKHGHEFSAENTILNAKGWRICRACRARVKAEYLARRQARVDGRLVELEPAEVGT